MRSRQSIECAAQRDSSFYRRNNYQGKIVATPEPRTAGKPAKILLAVDRKSLTQEWNDVAQVTVIIVDEKGVIVPIANHLISFKIAGAGQTMAVDNGDNASHESFQRNERCAYQGRCGAWLKAKASGKIFITVSAPELTSDSALLEILK